MLHFLEMEIRWDTALKEIFLFNRFFEKQLIFKGYFHVHLCFYTTKDHHNINIEYLTNDVGWMFYLALLEFRL